MEPCCRVWNNWFVCEHGLNSFGLGLCWTFQENGHSNGASSLSLVVGTHTKPPHIDYYKKLLCDTSSLSPLQLLFAPYITFEVAKLWLLELLYNIALHSTLTSTYKNTRGMTSLKHTNAKSSMSLWWANSEELGWNSCFMPSQRAKCKLEPHWAVLLNVSAIFTITPHESSGQT